MHIKNQMLHVDILIGNLKKKKSSVPIRQIRTCRDSDSLNVLDSYTVKIRLM
jgi:hypothetical protein